MVLQLLSADLRKLLQPANAKSVVYAALTAAFLGMTTSYIIAPVATLTSILQGASTPDCIALWRNVGAALLILPTWTVNLKVRTPRIDRHSRCTSVCYTHVWWEISPEHGGIRYVGPLRASGIGALTQHPIMCLADPTWHPGFPSYF